MANLIRWDPFREVADLQSTMDRLLERGFGRAFDRDGGDFYFPLDLYETDGDVVVRASLPGVRSDDLNVSITGDTLSIKAESKEEHEEKQPNYYRQERRYGSMQRAIALPVRVDADHAKAEFEDGVLTLRMPKAPEARSRTIEIKPKNIIDSAAKDRAA